MRLKKIIPVILALLTITSCASNLTSTESDSVDAESFIGSTFFDTESVSEIQTEEVIPEVIFPIPDHTGMIAPEGSIVVYLTFDDGPNAKNTGRILDILKDKGIHATFFTVGCYLSGQRDLIQRMHNEGHVVGCHSQTHNYTYLYANEVNFTSELDEWEKNITSVLGFVPEQKVFRFPGGSSKRKNKYKLILKDRGYKGFDWNALNNDCNLSKCPSDMSADQYLKKSLMDTLEYSFLSSQSSYSFDA